MDRLEDDVFGLEYLLDQIHVLRGQVFLSKNDTHIQVCYILVVLGEPDLILDGEEPLVEVVVRLGGEHVLSVVVFYLEAMLLLRMSHNAYSGIRKHNQVEVFVL